MEAGRERLAASTSYGSAVKNCNEQFTAQTSLTERSDRSAVLRAQRRGFSAQLITRLFIQHREMEGANALSLPDFFIAINDRKFDCLLLDEASGQSLS